jgi:hypothetical protein
LGIVLFHHVQHPKMFIGATITIAKQLGFLFQVEDRLGETAAIFVRKLGKFSENFGRTHDKLN